jgi:xylulokinase
MRYIIGIDVGTSSVKASLFCENGIPVASGFSSYETHHFGILHAEQDPQQWWAATVSALNRITYEFSLLKDGEIAGISVSSQSPSLVALDKQGQIIRPAMIWMDRRAEAETERLVNQIVGIDRYREILGAQPDAFYTLPKLMWYKENEPENYKKTHMLLQANGYINYMLTGAYAIDIYQAITTHAMDYKTQTWSSELGRILDIPFDCILPDIYKATDVIGVVNREAALVTGLKEGIPVAAGITDSMAAVCGMSVFTAGQSCDMTGTSTLVCMASADTITTGGALQVKPSILSGAGSYLMAPISSTGASVKWYAETLGFNEHFNGQTVADPIYDEMNLEAANAKCGSEGLFFFPYMAGERAPLWNSYSTGMFIGLTLKTKRKDIIRAIYEGTSYAVRHVYDEAKIRGFTPSVIYCGGGGCKSDIWLKIKASILNHELLVTNDDTDSSVRGNALIAGVAGGLYDDLKKAGKEFIKVTKTVEPNPLWTKIYDELYPYYRSLYSSVEPELIQLEKTVKHLNLRFREA